MDDTVAEKLRVPATMVALWVVIHAPVLGWQIHLNSQLAQAVFNHQVPGVERLLEKGAYPNGMTWYKYTARYLAFANDDQGILAMFDR